MLVTVLQIIALLWLATLMYVAVETKRGKIRYRATIVVLTIIPFALIFADLMGG